MRLRRTVIACAAVAVAGSLASTGEALGVTCNVAASGGYANCLDFANPGFEQAKAPSASATPYRFQLFRPSDGAFWGYWEWSDLNYHTVFLSLSGTIRAQVDNRGSGTAGYHVAMG